MTAIWRRLVLIILSLIFMCSSTEAVWEYQWWWYDQNEPPIAVPYQFWKDVSEVVWCESRDDPTKIGNAGELGRLQIHPIHFKRMRDWGFDPMIERDRNYYAISHIWMVQGWRPWSCRP